MDLGYHRWVHMMKLRQIVIFVADFINLSLFVCSFFQSGMSLLKVRNEFWIGEALFVFSQFLLLTLISISTISNIIFSISD